MSFGGAATTQRNHPAASRDASVSFARDASALYWAGAPCPSYRCPSSCAADVADDCCCCSCRNCLTADYGAARRHRCWRWRKYPHHFDCTQGCREEELVQIARSAKTTSLTPWSVPHICATRKSCCQSYWESHSCICDSPPRASWLPPSPVTCSACYRTVCDPLRSSACPATRRQWSKDVAPVRTCVCSTNWTRCLCCSCCCYRRCCSCSSGWGCLHYSAPPVVHLHRACWAGSWQAHRRPKAYQQLRHWPADNTVTFSPRAPAGTDVGRGYPRRTDG